MERKPNKRNLKERGDYGIRVARPGYDANNCANSQLLFNSGWPILQIAEVVNVKDSMEWHYFIDEHKEVYNKATGERISYEQKRYEANSVPEGYSSSSEQGDYSSLRSTIINKKYIIKISEDPSSDIIYYYPHKTSVVGDIVTEEWKYCRKIKYAVKRHSMGFVPMFIDSGIISNIDGYVLLFSVDVRTDVDYPYDDAPLPFLSGTKDYGVKSSSKFGKRVPGLSTNMFSKLVQCVKTEKTSYVTRNPDNPEEIEDNRVIWCPVPNIESEDEVQAEDFYKYEMYAFVESDFTRFVNPEISDEGGKYFERSYPTFVRKVGRVDGGLDSVWAVSSESFQSPHVRENSLVVLRSPLVSPEYEEIVI